jgi:hypothetical protein
MRTSTCTRGQQIQISNLGPKSRDTRFLEPYGTFSNDGRRLCHQSSTHHSQLNARPAPLLRIVAQDPSLRRARMDLIISSYCHAVVLLGSCLFPRDGSEPGLTVERDCTYTPHKRLGRRWSGFPDMIDNPTLYTKQNKPSISFARAPAAGIDKTSLKCRICRNGRQL